MERPRVRKQTARISLKLSSLGAGGFLNFCRLREDLELLVALEICG